MRLNEVGEGERRVGEGGGIFVELIVNELGEGAQFGGGIVGEVDDGFGVVHGASWRFLDFGLCALIDATSQIFENGEGDGRWAMGGSHSGECGYGGINVER